MSPALYDFMTRLAVWFVNDPTQANFGLEWAPSISAVRIVGKTIVAR